MPPILERPVPRLLSLREDDTPRRLIALAGVPGSGKTTLAARLADEVNALAGPGTLAVLGMDGFHLTRAELSRLPDPDEALARRGAPWTFNPQALAERLRALRDGAGRAPVAWPDFQHDVGDPVEAAFTVPAAVRLVLVEGLYLLHEADGWRAVGQSFDERWYLDVPLEIAMERLAARHMAAWGLSRADAESRIAANDRLNAGTVLESRNSADWRLAG